MAHKSSHNGFREWLNRLIRVKPTEGMPPTEDYFLYRYERRTWSGFFGPLFAALAVITVFSVAVVGLDALF